MTFCIDDDLEDHTANEIYSSFQPHLSIPANIEVQLWYEEY